MENPQTPQVLVEAKPEDPVRAANRARFELELEFVQALANPFYLHTLAQQNLLNNPAFINYLEYLQYWKEKDYARFIHYPHALHHLDLLQTPQFRAEIGTDYWRELLNQKQYDHWRTWRLDGKSIAGNIAASKDGEEKPGEGAKPEVEESQPSAVNGHI